MKNGQNPICFIPGLCFKPQIFRAGAYLKQEVTPINFHHNKMQTLSPLATELSLQIPNHSIIIAWSFGGLIATKIAYLYPNKIKKLVLLNSQPKFLAEDGWTGISATNVDHVLEQAATNTQEYFKYFKALVNYPNKKLSIISHINQYFCVLPKKMLVHYLQLLFYSDLRNDYAQIQKPILHMVGSNDAVIPQAPLQLKKLNNKTKVLSVEQGGHAAFLTCSEVAKRAIADFIDA